MKKVTIKVSRTLGNTALVDIAKVEFLGDMKERIPEPEMAAPERLFSIPGTPPNMIFPPKGDAFAERNQYAMQVDFEEEPPMFRVTDSHYAATWLLDERAPKVVPPIGGNTDGT